MTLKGGADWFGWVRPDIPEPHLALVAADHNPWMLMCDSHAQKRVLAYCERLADLCVVFNVPYTGGPIRAGGNDTCAVGAATL